MNYTCLGFLGITTIKWLLLFFLVVAKRERCVKSICRKKQTCSEYITFITEITFYTHLQLQLLTSHTNKNHKCQAESLLSYKIVRTFVIEQHVLDTDAGKQLSYAATGV